MMNIRVIFSLFLALTIGLTAMNAQNPYATLEKELEQYRQERRPRKVAETLKKIRVMAESRRDIPMLLHSMFLYDDPENDINDYPEEPLMNDLDKLMQASWLRPVDRAMILFMRLRMYVRYGQFGSAYMMGAVHGDPKDNRLSLWSEKQFEDAFLRDFDAFLSYRKALLQARTEDFRPLFESQPKNVLHLPVRSIRAVCLSLPSLSVAVRKLTERFRMLSKRNCAGQHLISLTDVSGSRWRPTDWTMRSGVESSMMQLPIVGWTS